MSDVILSLSKESAGKDVFSYRPYHTNASTKLSMTHPTVTLSLSKGCRRRALTKYTNPHIPKYTLLMSIAIKVENLSKAYQLGEIGTGTLSRDASTELSMTAFPHTVFVSKDVGIVKKNNANDCRNLEADFNEGEADKTAGRESGLWVEASFCSCPEASGWILFHQGKSN